MSSKIVPKLSPSFMDNEMEVINYAINGARNQAFALEKKAL